MKKLAKVIVGLFVLAGFALSVEIQTFNFSKSETKVSIAYPSSLSITIENVNRFDYFYTYRITYEVPKPVLPETPGPIAPGLKPQAASGEEIDKVNQALRNRLCLFGQKSLEQWYSDNKNILAALSDLIKEKNPVENAGTIAIGENEFADTLLKTGPGGALLIELTAIPRVWKYDPSNSQKPPFFQTDPTDSNGDGVIDTAEIQEFLKKQEISDEVCLKKILDHCNKRSYRIEFARSKTIVYSFGPYVSSIGRNIFGAVKNPNYVENSADADKKNKLVIGYQENSGFSYGVAAFWSAPIFSRYFGVSWGVAYNLQNQIDTAVNGLIGVYYRNPDVPVLINFGIAIGYVNRLPEGFTPYQTPIGEDETIPQTKKLNIGPFLSLSFII